jgi:hypothetical protein
VGNWDWEDHDSRKPRKKRFVKCHLSGKKLRVVAPACHSIYSRKSKIKGFWSRPAWAKSKILSPK